MTPAAIIQKVNEDGVTLTATPSGSIKASGDSVAVSRWLPIIRQNKPNILAALQDAEKALAPPNATEDAKKEALARLQLDPNVRYALVTPNPDTDPVLLTLYIRSTNQSIVTCDLLIPKAKYDPNQLQELIKKHGGTIH
jgi:hypothetical protein